MVSSRLSRRSRRKRLQGTQLAPSLRQLTLALLLTLLLSGCASASLPSVTVEIVTSTDPNVGSAYVPAVIHVRPGTEVTWVERDTRLHTVTANDDSFGSNFLRQGDQYTVRFNKPGDYHYHCAIHPQMTGEVIVD